MRLLEHNIRIVLDSYHNTRTRNSFTVQNVPIVVLNVYLLRSYCNILLPFYLDDYKNDIIEYFEFVKLYKNVD